MNNFCGSYTVPDSRSQCIGRQGGAATPEELSVESVRAGLHHDEGCELCAGVQVLLQFLEGD